MSTKTIKTTFKLRRGTLSEWTSKNPVLLLGEPGFETDTNKLKIGNGEDAWNDLPYVAGGSSGALEHSLTIGSHVFDGTADVTIPIYGGNNAEVSLTSLLSAAMTLGSTGVDGEDGTVQMQQVRQFEVTTDSPVMQLDVV